MQTKTKHKVVSKKYTEGFSLIELLIVISIIGILSNTFITFAKEGINKAYDANIRSTLGSLRTSAVDEALTYDPYSFVNVCSGSPVDLILEKLGDENGLLSADYQCTSTQNEWVAIFPLKSKPGYFCTDSSGNAQYALGFLDSALDGNLNCDHATVVPAPTPTPTPPPPPSPTGGVTICNDTLDNDSDGFVDFPADLGCDTPTDSDEANVAVVNTAPVLTLIGANPYEFWSPSMNPFAGNAPNKYNEPGYTVADAEDGNISNTVAVTGPTLISTTGPNNCKIRTYEFVYQVIDSGGLSDSETRTVVHHKCNQP